MKKLLSILLAVLLVFSAMAPITVFAENGPHPYNPDSSDADNEEFSYLTFIDFDTSDMYVLYPSSLSPDQTSSAFSGASYDLETNTLTLKNVKSKTSVLSVADMGDDFKINLIGYNELSSVISTASTRGGSITITGEGELVLNRNKEFSGILISGESTASVLHIDDTAKLKIYATDEEDGCSIDISDSTVLTLNKLINLGKNAKFEGDIEFETYTVDIYEQKEAYDIYYNCIDTYDAGFQKDGQYFVGMADYSLVTFEPNGKYTLFAISYDETLDCYVSTPYSGDTPIKPTGFKQLTDDEPIYDKSRKCYIGFDYYSEFDSKNTYKTIFSPDYKDSFDLCVDKAGTRYGFEQNTYEYDDGTSETEVYVYTLVDHPKYGCIAFCDESIDSMDGFKPLKIGEKELSKAIVSSDIVINNGGSVIEPSMVKDIQLKNTNQGVKISWNAVATAEKYRVYRKTENGNWTKLTTVDADETGFIDKTAKNGTSYYYTVRAANYVGWGNYNKNGVAITHIDTPEFSVKNTDSGIHLKWTQIAKAQKYRIYRQTAGSSEWVRIDTVKTNKFTDTSAKLGQKYSYRVKAVIGNDTSSCNTVTVYRLSTPALISVKNTVSGVSVNWKKVSGAQGYKIYRKSGSGDWSLIGTTDNNKSFTFTDSKAKSGKTYSYTVVAYNGKSNSTHNSAGLSIKYIAAPDTKIKVYENKIKLSWQSVAGAKGYEVYRKANGSAKWTKLTTTEKLYFKDSSVKNNTNYSYCVKAVNGNAASAYKTLKLTFLATPKLTALKLTDSGAKLKWTKVTGAEGYKVYRKTESENWICIDKVTNAQSYTDRTAETGITYYYTVRAYNGKSMSYYNTTGLSVEIPEKQ